MTTKDAIAYFGNMKALCQFLNIHPASVYAWREYPPRAKQFELQVRTGNALKAEQAIIDNPSK
jgi:hypothetical protein